MHIMPLLANVVNCGNYKNKKTYFKIVAHSKGGPRSHVCVCKNPKSPPPLKSGGMGQKLTKLCCALRKLADPEKRGYMPEECGYKTEEHKKKMENSIIF
jgi:hypothetical protein